MYGETTWHDHNTPIDHASLGLGHNGAPHPVAPIGGGSRHPAGSLGGGVLSPEPEHVERTRDYTSPYSTTYKSMTPDEQALPPSMSHGHVVAMGSSDPTLTPPIHEYTVTSSGRKGFVTDATPGTGVAALDQMHQSQTQGIFNAQLAANGGNEPSPQVHMPSNYVAADPFSNPSQFKPVPGTSNMAYIGSSGTENMAPESKVPRK